MVGRVKFQVLGKHGWATAYAPAEKVWRCRDAFVRYGIWVRLLGRAGLLCAPDRTA